MREGKVLFNDALNTYLRLYGIRHMVKDNLNCKRGNGLPFPSSSKGSFICTIPERIALDQFFMVDTLSYGITKCVVCIILSGMVHAKDPLLLIDKSSQ